MFCELADMHLKHKNQSSGTSRRFKLRLEAGRGLHFLMRYCFFALHVRTSKIFISLVLDSGHCVWSSSANALLCHVSYSRVLKLRMGFGVWARRIRS
eukprot:72487-Rhodomonas_salina.4